jgi:hypothetical protein
METKITPEYQESVFNDIARMQFRLRHLALYLQNEFEDALSKKTITKRQIEKECLSCNDDFDKFITDLTDLKHKSLDIMLHYIK